MTFSEITASTPILATLQLLPLLTGLLLIRIRGEAAVALASIASVAQLFLSIGLYLQFDRSQPAGVMQFAEHIPLLGAFHYHAAVDGIGVLFLFLTSLLGLLNVMFILIRKLHESSILAVMMGIQATLVSQFVTVDILWFSLMSCLEILLVGYITKRWPTFHDIQPTLARYLQFMAAGLLLLLFGTLLLGWSYADTHNGQWSFSLYQLAELHFGAHDRVGTLIFFALFYGLGVRIPIFPLHGWLPSFMINGNVAVAPIYLLGLKVGVYALLRFVFPIVPQAVLEWHTIATVFAASGVFYAAFLAMRQRTLREMLAFAVISHTGILTIGLFSLHPMGFRGSILLALNFGVAITGLALMTGMVWQRTRTTRMSKLGGLLDYIPIVGIAFLVAGLAIVGMPGTPGFDAVHFVLEGSIKRFGALVTIAAALGNLVAAGFLLRAFQHAFLGQPQKSTSHWDTHPTYPAETVMAAIVMLVIVGVGFYSAPWTDLIAQPVEGLSALFPTLNMAELHGGEH
jgi:NADH-quinone oxidoreductase subunit M